jgi:hypothetical protein
VDRPVCHDAAHGTAVTAADVGDIVDTSASLAVFSRFTGYVAGVRGIPRRIRRAILGRIQWAIQRAVGQVHRVAGGHVGGAVDIRGVGALLGGVSIPGDVSDVRVWRPVASSISRMIGRPISDRPILLRVGTVPRIAARG